MIRDAAHGVALAGSRAMSDVPVETCRVCRGASTYVFSQPVLGRPVRYFDCAVCGYVQTQTPDWLEEAYSRAINDVDTGIMMRNRLNVGRVVMTLVALRRLRGRVTDHAGGYGILVRMLRDVGIEARWRDKYCENLLARGFEDTGGGCDLATAFEVFEHLVDPLQELADLLGEAPSVLLSTDLITSERTPSPDWWYFGPEHGQHIGFFRGRTLRWMALKLGCHHATDGAALHLFSRTPISRLWLPLVRLRRFARVAARLSLRSKTNDDFAQLRGQR
jgi:hypothetical protein